MANSASFQRDFGYLMPFLDKLRTAADSLDPAARTELLRLLEGEPARWRQIQALLAGSKAPGAPAGTSEPTRAADESTATPELTVGSLKAPRSRPSR